MPHTRAKTAGGTPVAVSLLYLSLLALVLLALVLLIRPLGAQQSDAGSSNSSSQGSSSSNTGAEPSQQGASGNDNSFPEAVSRKAAKDSALQNKKDEQPPDAPQQPSAEGNSQAPAGSSDPDNAFPEETSKKAAADARGTSSANASRDTSAGSGVSSSGDYDRRMAGSGRTAVPINAPMPHVNGKDPVKEDVSVGTFYLSTGDYQGAYQRFHEASLLAPENTDAIFGLAEAARHLKKREEAMSNYQLFLQVVPSGSKAKDARKAMASLEKAK